MDFFPVKHGQSADSYLHIRNIVLQMLHMQGVPVFNKAEIVLSHFAQGEETNHRNNSFSLNLEGRAVNQQSSWHWRQFSPKYKNI